MEVLVTPADADQPEGPEVVRKTACLPDERQRLLREAEVLRAASERGVPGLAALVSPPSPEAAEPCLITAAVAGPSLAVAVPLVALEVAGVVAEVARLLACLHDAGLVHGALEPSHVVLDGEGGAILVGLGDGGPAGSPSLNPAAGPLDPADDVAAWGALVSHLLDSSVAGDGEPLVALRQTLSTRRVRRAGRRPPPSRPDKDERRVLAALADQAQDPDPARRPAARSLAAAVIHRIPAARVPGAVAVAPPVAGSRTGSGSVTGLLDRLAAHVTPTAPPPAPAPPAATPADPGGVGAAVTAPRARRRATGGKKAPPSTGLLVPAASGAASPSAPGPPAPSGTSPPSATPRPEGPDDAAAQRTRPPATTGHRRWAVSAAAVLVVAVPVALARLGPPDQSHPGAARSAPGGACSPAQPPVADVDGDGCEEAVRWAEGILQAGSARFGIGGPGDAWAVGDWDCDGRRTLALLHAGALAVYDDWPGPGGELQGRQIATAGGATGIAAVTGPGGCERPALRRPGAADLPIDARRPP